MWSKQKSPRFAVEKPANPIGPGYYDLPSLLDEHSVTITASERFQEQMPGETPGPGSYTQAGKAARPKQSKENRPPSPAKGASLKLGQKEGKDELQHQLQEQERLRAQAEQRVKQLTASAQSVAAEFAELRGKHFSATKAQEESQVIIKNLQQSLSLAEGKVPQLEKMLSDVEDKDEKLQKQLKEEARLRAEAEATVQQSTAAAESAAKEFAELRGKHFTLTQVQEESQAVIQNLQQSLRAAEDKVPSLEKQKAEVQAQLDAARAEVDGLLLQKEQNKVEVTDLQNSLRLAQEEVPKLQGQLVEVEGQLAAALAEVTHLKAEKELSEAVVKDLQQALAKAEDQVPVLEKRLAEVEARNCQTLADLAAAEADGSQVKDLQEQLTAARAAMADLVTDKEESLATIKNLQGSLSQAQEQVPQLQKELREAEARLTAAGHDLGRLREEKVPKLETQLREAEERLTAASDDLARLREEKEQSHLAMKELQQSLRMAEDEANRCKAELEAVQSSSSQAKDLQEQLTAARAEIADAVMEKEQMKTDLEKLRFAEINANMTKNAKERAEAQLREAKQDLEHWRSKALSFERDEDRMKRQEEDVCRLEREVKELHDQNLQLLTTFQQFKSEWEVMRAENQSLQETLAMSEMSLDRASEEKAQIMGHVNPKQKIRHMVNLKEENEELREQLKKAKQRITQLGVSRKGEGLLEALACFSHGRGLGADQLSIPASACPETPGPASVRGEARTPRRPTTPSRKASPRRGNLQEEEYQAWLAEEERRRQMQERAVERVQTDFQHFIALIERAVLSDSGAESPNPAALLERLRAVVHPGDSGSARDP